MIARVPWWLWSLFVFLAVMYGITDAAGASKRTTNLVTWAVGLPLWVVLALLIRLGRRRQAREQLSDEQIP